MCGVTSEEPRTNPDPRATIEQATGRPMLTAQGAAVTLRTSPTDVWLLVQAGRLDAAVSAGEVFVFAEQVDGVVMARLREQREEAVTLLGPYTDALRSYLAHTPATGDPDVALAEGRPLITTRRGPRRRHGGLTNHGVLVQARALSRFAAERSALDAHGLDPEQRYAAWQSLPAAPALYEGLLLLPGVERQHNGTGIAGVDYAPRRLHEWVRVDPLQYPPTMAPELADLVDDSPAARERVAEREAAAQRQGTPDDPWAEV